MEFYVNRWGTFNRPGLDPRLARRVWRDYKETIKDNVRWYLIVGAGGSGKTTLGMNIAYFLDKKFDHTYIVTEWVDLVKIMMKLPKTKAKRAILMDEPDLSHHPSSKMGEKISSILNKARQQHLFLVFCSTSLRHIKPFLFEKMHVLCYTPNKGDVEVYRDNHTKKRFPLSEIKQKYSKLNFEIFNVIKGRKFHTYNFVPLSDEDMDKYLEYKAGDYEEDINDFLSMATGRMTSKQLGRRFELDQKKIKQYVEIMKDKALGKTHTEIAVKLGLSMARITQIIKEMQAKGY